MQDFDQSEVGEVAVESSRGPFALFGNGVYGKFKGYAAVVANTGFDAIDQFDVDAIAGGEIATRLRDADNGFARLEFFARPAIVHVAFDINGCHAHVVRVVEPLLTPQLTFDFRIIFLHRCSFCFLFIQYSEKYLGLSSYARNKAFCILELHFKELH